MLEKIIAFFMAIITFFANLFGITLPGTQPEPEPTQSYVWLDTAYGDHEQQNLDLYIPKDNDGTIGLALFIHGGAWVRGDKSYYSRDTLQYVSEDLGYAAAAINYRYVSADTSFNDLLDDVGASLQFIKEKGEEVGVNINKVLLTGISAGGHLSLMYAYSRADTAPITPAVVYCESAPTNLTETSYFTEPNDEGSPEFLTQLVSWGCEANITLDNIAEPESQAALLAASPISYVDENTVPTVIAQAINDKSVPYSNAVDLDEKLTEYGVRHDFVVFPNSGHLLQDDPDCLERSQGLAIQYAAEYMN